MKNNLKIVFIIIATLVGAGFASGKEIYLFFFAYGIYGVWGIFFSSLIISAVVYTVLKICIEKNIDKYSDFCRLIGSRNKGNTFKIKNVSKIENVSKIKNKLISQNRLSSENKSISITIILNIIVNIFLLITFFIMISGFATFLKQEFNINKILGSIIIIILCYITLRNNISGLIKISDYLIPILIVFLLCISLKNVDFIDNYNNIFANIQLQNNIAFPIMATIKSILYACYNCIILIPVLVTTTKVLKKNNTFEKDEDYLEESYLKKDKNNIKKSYCKKGKYYIKNNNCKINNNIIKIAIITFIVIIILSLSIYNLLLQGNQFIFSLEMPIIKIMEKYGNIYRFLYLIMIVISIFTTAISTGYGFLSNCSRTDKKYKINTILICVFSILFSQLSFSFLINLLYPVLGIVGIFELILLIVKNNKGM